MHHARMAVVKTSERAAIAIARGLYDLRIFFRSFGQVAGRSIGHGAIAHELAKTCGRRVTPIS